MVLIFSSLIGSFPCGVSETELLLTLKLDLKDDIRRDLFSDGLTESVVQIHESS